MMNKYRMGDIVDVISEREDNPANCEYDKFVGLEHYVSGDVEINSYGKTDLLASAMKIFKAGDILIARRNVYLRRASVVNFDGITSGDSIVLRTKEEVMKKLLPFVLNTDNFWEYADKFSDGTMSKRLSPKLLLDYEFNLPNTNEQEKLAELLWAANDTKEAYKELLSLTDELIEAQFVEMFGDPVENPMGWDFVTLSGLAEIRIGPFGSILHKADYIVNGHPLVNPSHIIDGVISTDDELSISDQKYTELSAYHLEVGDVVLGRRGEMGRCAVVHNEGLVCGTGSILIRPNKTMHPYFLHKIISYPSFKRNIENMAVGVTMMNLNVPIVSSFMIPLLPMSKQEAYLAIVQQSDKSKLALQQTITSLENTIKSLMQQYVG